MAPRTFQSERLLSTVSGHGLYRPGQTLLHVADPRLKVLSCLLLVILTFAAGNWTQLALLFAALSMAFWLSSSPFSVLWPVCRMLRWLLLLTLLMHLLLSPGRTLWGTSWLSLDGFLTGLFVCLQILMAVIASALLGITTSTESLADVFGWFARPFQRLGFRTDEWQGLMLQALEFLPVIQEEVRAARGAEGANRSSAGTPDANRRWARWVQKANDLLFRLVDRGDAMAHHLAASEEPSPVSGNCAPLFPMAFSDRLLAGVMTLIIICYWVIR